MTSPQDYAAIARTVQLYVEGMCLNDPEKTRQAMHEKACSVGHFQGGLEWDPREVFIAGVADATEAPDPSPWYRIKRIAVTGDVAIAEVEDIWLGMHFDDVLTLLRHDDAWIIVSKVFFHRTG